MFLNLNELIQVSTDGKGDGCGGCSGCLGCAGASSRVADEIQNSTDSEK